MLLVRCRSNSADSSKESQLRGMLSAGLISQAEFEQNLATLQRSVHCTPKLGTQSPAYFAVWHGVAQGGIAVPSIYAAGF